VNTKQPFDIAVALRRIRTAVKPYPPAAMFQLADEGFTTPFEQLVACILSIRTFDETMLVTARRLFATARTPEALAALSPAEIDALIRSVSFHEGKAPQLQALAQRTVEEFGGELPCDDEILQSFAGVGPKCAHLVLGIACGQAHIGVDVHVHRVTNRWGYVTARSPEQTMVALEKVLPERYWVEINRLLVPFGKHICTGTRPRCSTCPVLEMCRQIGVVNPR
jgi:endonuclease-3